MKNVQDELNAPEVNPVREAIGARRRPTHRRRNTTRRRRKKPKWKKLTPEENAARPMRRTQIVLRNIEKDYKSGYELSKRRMRLMMKWRRNRKRRRKAKVAKKKAKQKNRLPSCVPHGTVFLSTGTRRRMAIKKKKEATRRRRAEKLLKQRRRRINQFHGHRWKRTLLQKKVLTMTAAQVRALLSRKKLKRLRKRRRQRTRLKILPKPKRRALKLITRAIRIAKHKKKKQLRFKRYVMAKRTTKAENPVDHVCSAPETVKWKRIHPEVDVNDEYVNDCPEKVVLLMPDELFTLNTEHIPKETNVMLDCGLFIQLRDPAKGIAGRVQARILLKKANIRVHFRFRLHDDTTTANDERTIMSMLLKGGSENCLRIMYAGCHEQIRYMLTTMYELNLEELMDKYKTFQTRVSVHIVEQTFICVKELHKLGYCYTRIRPSAYAVCKNDPRRLVLTDYLFMRTFKEIHDDFINTRPLDEERVDTGNQEIVVERLNVNPYSSRRQHLRSFRGPCEDYESWFYCCARVMNGEPLKWEAQTDPFEMLLSKIDFPKEYGHPDETVNDYMATLHEYALSATLTNCNTVAYFISKTLEEWKRTFYGSYDLPWVDKREIEIREEKKLAKLKEQAVVLRQDEEELKKELVEWCETSKQQVAEFEKKEEKQKKGKQIKKRT